MLFLSALFPALKPIITFAQNVTQTANNDAKVDSIRRLIISGLSNSQSGYGIESVRLQKNGSLKNSSEEIVLINNKNLAPSKSDDILSFLKLNNQEIWTAIRNKSSSLFFCYSNPNSSPLSNKVKHWMLIGLDGYSQFEGSLKKTKTKHPACPNSTLYKADLTPSNNQMFAGNSFSLNKHKSFGKELLRTALIAMPIEDCYSIYLDKSKNLRRLSHITIENQPIANDIDSFHIKEETYSMMRLEISVKRKKEINSTYSIVLPAITATTPYKFLDIVM